LLISISPKEPQTICLYYVHIELHYGLCFWDQHFTLILFYGNLVFYIFPFTRVSPFVSKSV